MCIGEFFRLCFIILIIGTFIIVRVVCRFVIFLMWMVIVFVCFVVNVMVVMILGLLSGLFGIGW